MGMHAEQQADRKSFTVCIMYDTCVRNMVTSVCVRVCVCVRVFARVCVCVSVWGRGAQSAAVLVHLVA